MRALRALSLSEDFISFFAPRSRRTLRFNPRLMGILFVVSSQTMIYTHTVKSRTTKEMVSPLDLEGG